MKSRKTKRGRPPRKNRLHSSSPSRKKQKADFDGWWKYYYPNLDVINNLIIREMVDVSPETIDEILRSPAFKTTREFYSSQIKGKDNQSLVTGHVEDPRQLQAIFNELHNYLVTNLEHDGLFTADEKEEKDSKGSDDDIEMDGVKPGKQEVIELQPRAQIPSLNFGDFKTRLRRLEKYVTERADVNQVLLVCRQWIKTIFATEKFSPAEKAKVFRLIPSPDDEDWKCLGGVLTMIEAGLNANKCFFSYQTDYVEKTIGSRWHIYCEHEKHGLDYGRWLLGIPGEKLDDPQWIAAVADISAEQIGVFRQGWQPALQDYIETDIRQALDAAERKIQDFGTDIVNLFPPALLEIRKGNNLLKAIGFDIRVEHFNYDDNNTKVESLRRGKLLKAIRNRLQNKGILHAIKGGKAKLEHDSKDKLASSPDLRTQGPFMHYLFCKILGERGQRPLNLYRTLRSLINTSSKNNRSLLDELIQRNNNAADASASLPSLTKEQLQYLADRMMAIGNRLYSGIVQNLLLYDNYVLPPGIDTQTATNDLTVLLSEGADLEIIEKYTEALSQTVRDNLNNNRIEEMPLSCLALHPQGLEILELCEDFIELDSQYSSYTNPWFRRIDDHGNETTAGIHTLVADLILIIGQTGNNREKEQAINMLDHLFRHYGGLLYDSPVVDNGMFPIDLAARYGAYELLAKLLFEYKAQPLPSPLWWAVNEGHIKVITLLLNVLPTHFVDEQLWETAMKKARIEVISKLLVRGADKFIAKKDFAEAVKDGDHKMVALLLEYGAKKFIRTKHKHDETPLHLAMLHGHVKIVDLLLGNGAEQDLHEYIKLYDNEGRYELVTPFLMAVINGHHEVVERLLSQQYRSGIINQTIKDDSHTNHAGMSALHLAVLKNDRPMVEILLKYGVDLDIKSTRGDTALQVAINDRQNAEIVELIKSRTN